MTNPQEAALLASDPAPESALLALPPLGEEQAMMDMTCAYGIPPSCPRRATWHIIWTPDGENSIGCDEHTQEAEKRWTRYDRHPLTETCGLPDSNIIWSWDEPPGRCVWVVSENTMAADLSQPGWVYIAEEWRWTGAGLPSPLRGSHDLLSHPDTDTLTGLLGSGHDAEQLVIGQADALDVAAGVVDGRSSSSRHGVRLAPTESLRKVLPEPTYGNTVSPMSSNRVSKDRTCECGRTFAKYQGLEIHTRSCAVEQRRSSVFVDGYAGMRGWDAVVAWREAGRG